MKILVAGGAGYVGSVLCPMLVDQGHEVVVLDRFFFETTLPSEVRRIECDTRAACESHVYGVDRVIDLAGISNDPACDLDPRATIDYNFRGGVNLASVAYRAGVADYIYASSCAVYGDQPMHGHQPDERSTPRPLSEYARSKLSVERALERVWHGHEVAIYRFATVFGLSPRMRFDLAPNLMALHAQQGKPIELWSSPLTLRPFVHVRDLARLLAAETPIYGITNIGADAQTMTIQALAEIVASERPTTIVHKDAGDDRRSYSPSFKRLELELRFEPELLPRISLGEGVSEIIRALDCGLVKDGLNARTVQRYKRLQEAGLL